MSVGGATWDTAAPFDLTGSNTFDPDDADLDSGDGNDGGLTYHAWWTVTRTTASRVTAQLGDSSLRGRVYTGDSYAARVWVDTDFADDGISPVWDAEAGVTYHLLVGVSSDPPASYSVSGSTQFYVFSDWFDVLQDSETNYLIVTEGSRAADNPNPAYQGFTVSGIPFPTWFQDVIRVGLGRGGDYLIQEVFGGAEIDEAAANCAIEHAMNGEDDQQYWNSSTTDSDDTGEPACRPLAVGGDADEGLPVATTSFSVGINPGADLVAGGAFASAGGPSYGLFLRVPGDNLPPWGALFSIGDIIDPTAYGLPEDAQVEWEADHPDVESIQLADGEPTTDPAATGGHHANEWAYRYPFNPDWQNGSTGPWQIGNEQPHEAPTLLNPYVLFHYDSEPEDPAEVWWTIPFSDERDWDSYVANYEYVPGEAPDEADGVITAWPFSPEIPADITTSDFESGRSALPAVRFNLRAQRFRFRYLSDMPPVTPPRQIFGRPGDIAQGAAQVYGQGATIQGGSAVYGGVL